MTSFALLRNLNTSPAQGGDNGIIFPDWIPMPYSIKKNTKNLVDKKTAPEHEKHFLFNFLYVCRYVHAVLFGCTTYEYCWELSQTNEVILAQSLQINSVYGKTWNLMSIKKITMKSLFGWTR